MRQNSRRPLIPPSGVAPARELDAASCLERIAERHASLLPDEANARRRAIAWMFTALGTVEPPIVERSMTTLLEREEPWHEQRLRVVEERIRVRLAELSRHLGKADWLEGGFSAGDLLMVHTLLRLAASGILDEHPNLTAYVARGQARPDYKRAFDAQRAVFMGMPPDR